MFQLRQNPSRAERFGIGEKSDHTLGWRGRERSLGYAMAQLEEDQPGLRARTE
jgi:hypothetical protein